jgi:hypothetical protein
MIMKNRNLEFNFKTHQHCMPLNSGLIVVIMILFASQTLAQSTISTDTASKLHSKKEASQKKKPFKMTTLTFGGNGALFTRINNQNTIMTGGRGSATFNHRYTIGGGGWGMTKGVEVKSNNPDTYAFAKMGYGGIDFGYLFFPGEKLNIGTKLLIAGGAVFKETVPESNNNGFRMFPVLEPSIYYQISLGKLFRFEMGASYRYIWGTNLPYASDRDLSGISCYIGFLVRACNCD